MSDVAVPVAVIAALVFFYCVYCDIRYRILPDTASIILVILALVRWALMGEWAPFIWAFACGMGVFVIGAIAFARGWMGGGDVKLMSATSFLIGADAFSVFFLVMALAGGVLSVIVLVWHYGARLLKKNRFAPGDAGELPPPVPSPTVPYGAAIALAGVYVLYLQCRLGVN